MMRALMVVVTAAVLAGCVSAKVEQIRTTPGKAVPLAAGDSVVILSRRQHGDRQTEDSFNRCLESKLTRADMPVIAESVFVDTLYPWLEPRLAQVFVNLITNAISFCEDGDAIRV